MTDVSMIGIDLAKNVFQLHGATSDGGVVFRKKLSRSKVLAFIDAQPRCVVAMEACGGAQHWARQIGAMGHEVRLMPPRYVKPFVKRQKNDQADAEAIVDAASRKNMRFVAVKDEDQQARAMRHNMRCQLKRQQTQAINLLRSYLAEFGVVVPKGKANVTRLSALIEAPECTLPPLVVELARDQLERIDDFARRIAALDRAVREEARADATARRLMTIPGVGPMTATALRALAPPPETFRRGRDFAASLGLTPKQHSTGGKPRLGRISKEGPDEVRRLLITGAMAVVRHARRKGTEDPWLARQIARKPTILVAIALANKMARIAWALMVHGGVYRAPATTS